MTDKQIQQTLFNLVSPLLDRIEREEDCDHLEFQIDAICEDLTEHENNLLDEALEQNGYGF